MANIADPHPLEPSVLTSGPASHEARSSTHPERLSADPGCYPPVESVIRALEVLREVNRQGIATVRGLHKATGQNKSTVVRMLQTLVDAGYVVADKLCGGYRTTKKVRELVSGYDFSSRIIEAVRPVAIDLTERYNWPVGLGFIDDDAIKIQLYTGAISPWSHSAGVIQKRPKLTMSAMGRAYLAFCPPDELEVLLERLRETTEMAADAEGDLRRMLDRIRSCGYSVRDSRIEPRRMTTIAMPVREHGEVIALMSCSFYKTVICDGDIVTRAVKPLSEAIAEIERVLSRTEAGQVSFVEDDRAPSIGASEGSETGEEARASVRH